MATVNIGNLTFTHRGDYDGSTAYAKNDVVYYATNGNAYIAKQATTGNAPTNGTYWSQFAAGSGGIWNAGLSLGSAGQVVKVNSGASALEFGTITSKVVAHSYAENSDTYNNTNTSSDVTATNYTITHTPQSASNILLIEFMPNVRHDSGGGDTNFSYVITRTIGGTTTDFFTNGSDADYWYDSSGGNRLQFMRYYQFRDNTHNTTSAITYGVRFRNPHSTKQISISNSSGLSRWGIWELQP